MSTMKILLLSLWLAGIAVAGESGLVTIYQPLASEDGITILPVTCLDWNAHSGLPPASFITQANFAPTNVPKGPIDINLASTEKLSIRYSERNGNSERPVFTLSCRDATRRPNQINLALLARATLECLRLSFPIEVAKAEFEFELPEELAELKAVTTEFVKHDKAKPFFPPTQ